MSYLTWDKDDSAAWVWQDQFADSYDFSNMGDFSLESSRVLVISPGAWVLILGLQEETLPTLLSFLTVSEMPPGRGPLDKQLTS